jgi:hypothetical protein
MGVMPETLIKLEETELLKRGMLSQRLFLKSKPIDTEEF